jgi:lipooligosaccharide transport system permease protein
MVFGLPPSPGMVLFPFVGFLTGFGFGLFGIWISAVVPGIDSFNYVISAVLTPLFLVAGTFFPVGNLRWARVASQANPLFHCVELVRHAAFGIRPLADLWHAGFLVAFGSVMWLLAVRQMRRRLVD